MLTFIYQKFDLQFLLCVIVELFVFIQLTKQYTHTYKKVYIKLILETLNINYVINIVIYINWNFQINNKHIYN